MKRDVSEEQSEINGSWLTDSSVFSPQWFSTVGLSQHLCFLDKHHFVKNSMTHEGMMD